MRKQVKAVWRIVSDVDTLLSFLGGLGIAIPTGIGVAVVAILQAHVWIIVVVALSISALLSPVIVGALLRRQRLRIESGVELLKLHVENIRITKQDR